jgi:predicted GNAT family N-acyltransferase
LGGQWGNFTQGSVGNFCGASSAFGAVNSSMIVFRAYKTADFESCLKIFDSNTPEYFARHERLDFVAHFEESQIYFVLEKDKEVVACGGLEQVRAGIWVLTYGMVKRKLHGQGLGTLLLEKRLEWLRRREASELHLDTSQHSKGFYLRFGFVEQGFVANGYGEGFDRFDMVLKF